MKIIFENNDEKEELVYALQYNGYKLTQNNLDIILEALPNLGMLIDEFDIYMQDGRVEDLEEDEEITNKSPEEQEEELQKAVATFKFETD